MLLLRGIPRRRNQPVLPSSEGYSLTSTLVQPPELDYTRELGSEQGSEREALSTSQHSQLAANKFWVDDSTASERMTADATSFESYERAPPGDGKVESANGKFLPMAGYGQLRLLVYREGKSRCLNASPTCRMWRTTPYLGESSCRDATVADAHDAATAVIQPRHGRKSLTFKIPRRNNSLFEIKERRYVASRKEQEKPSPSKSLAGRGETCARS